MSLLKAALSQQPERSAREAALAETARRWRDIANAAADPFVESVARMLSRLVAASASTDVMLTSLQEPADAAPDVGPLHYYLGFYPLHSRQADEAVASFTRAIERGFSIGWSHSMRADARELAGDLKEAAKDHVSAQQHDETLVRSRAALERLRHT